jgi:hypothetical protein
VISEDLPVQILATYMHFKCMLNSRCSTVFELQVSLLVLLLLTKMS